jgi:hypothetical protein
MAKRASESNLIGSRGQSAVRLMFEILDWGPVPVPLEHDDGTDFFVQVRDIHRFELGLLLGVQVKNEKRYFSKRARSKALTDGGWAYSASQDDAKYWLEHSVPHIVALYDRASGIAYWAHVTVDSVRWTNAGAKIWIPDCQRIDGNCRDALLKVAATVKPASTWSGSSLDEISKIAPQSRLRYALLTPRIAAPHLNQPYAALSGEEAIASLMLCRLRELTQYEQQNLMPNQADRSTGSWEWRFFEALRTYLISGELESLMGLLDEPARAHQRTAARAAYLAFLAEQGEYQAGSNFFMHLDLNEINDPVDRAWLSVHGARCLLERGHKQESLQAALEASVIGAVLTEDAPALTISAAAFSCAFSAADLSEHFESMIRANDVAPLWWRHQQRAWALSAQFNQEFEEWAGKDHARYPEETTAWQHLRSIVLTSGAAGDHQAWRTATAQLARFELMMKSSQFRDNDYGTALRDLRLAGDDKAVGLAVKRLGEDGPSNAVAIAGHQLDFFKSTRTSLASDLKLITAGADLLSDSDADRHATWALAMLADPARLQHATQSGTWTYRYVVQMLQSLWPRLGRQAMDATRSLLTEMPYVANQLHAVEFARLVQTIGSEGWTEYQISGIRGRLAALHALADEQVGDAAPAGASESTTDHDERSLTDAWRWLLSEVGDETHKQQLLREAGEGSQEALLAIGSVDGFPLDVATQIIGHLCRELAKQREAAAQGQGDISELDEGSTLLKMNLHYPQLAEWEPIADLLRGPAFSEQQTETIKALTQAPERIPPSVATVLGPHLRQIAAQPSSSERFSFIGIDVPELARRAVEALEPELSDPSEIARRLAHGRDSKQALARSLGAVGEKSQILLLAALARDDQSMVRAAAASAATRWVVRDIEPTFAQELVDTLLGERGTRIAQEVTRAIPQQEDLTRVEPILRKLERSNSAAVRRRAAGLLESRPTAGVVR